MTGIPRYRAFAGPALLAAGFRPFFLFSAVWACMAVPLWLMAYTGSTQLPIVLESPIWHAHEMVFGYAAATIAGFLLTAIPNWTGRMPLQGGPLAILVALWLAGRVAVLLAAVFGPFVTCVLDLAFPATFLGAVAREIIAGRNWRNLPMVAALATLLSANALVHLEAIGVSQTSALGNRLGIATLLMLISFIGGRIIPSFTRNWLVKQNQPGVATPARFSWFDQTVLAITAAALGVWVVSPEGPATPWLCLLAGVAQGLRLTRWRGLATWREPLLWILHLGYAWLAFGLCLLGIDALTPWLPPSAALHALTVGGVGTMTLAVMTRATLGHTGRSLTADHCTTTIYGLVTAAAVLRVVAPLTGEYYLLILSVAGTAWTGAFGLFALHYLRLLALRQPCWTPTSSSQS